ncbi:MAG: squalene synthase HpnC [Rhodopirellula sp.]|nr:squalene synthase HpnC [Rhodopirellula sp.]OUX50532.1 MAG: squalene synthase HpnC [Rhodopirellula sp. TMED283]
MASSSNHGEFGDCPHTLRQSRAFTRKIATSHYENFLVASILLPKKLRQPFYDVYAFCRTADDLADESPNSEEALRGLERFQYQLDATFKGCPQTPLFVALHATIQHYQIPKQPFDDLLDAFRQDQHRNRYTSIEDLLEYCQRSANPVGHIVLHLGDSYTAENRVLSDHICTGLQLANFWQDVARDFAMDRIYIPQTLMREFGVDEEMFRQNTTAEPLRRLLDHECKRAEAMFRTGLPLAKRVKPWLANDVKLFAHGGLQTLRAIQKIEFDVLGCRPTVGKMQQFGLVLRVLAGRL